MGQLKEIDDVNQILKSGDALIHYAVLAENAAIVKLLIEASCDVNIKDTYSQQTCLHYCGEYGYLDIAQLLLDNGADLSITDLYGNEPLWTVVTSLEKNDKKRLAVISLFLKAATLRPF